jgi:hypothetical protein
MKKILLIIGIAVAIVVIGLVGLLAYLGLFSTVAVVEKEMGPYTVVYESFVGPYAKTGQVFDQLYKSLKADGIEAEDGIGIYYDNPAKVPANQLRSDCASVLTADQAIKAQTLGPKYRFKTIEKSPGLVAEFPIRNALSYMVAPMKTYPALAQAAKTKGYTTGVPYEYYAMKTNQMFVVAPVLPSPGTEAGK